MSFFEYGCHRIPKKIASASALDALTEPFLGVLGMVCAGMASLRQHTLIVPHTDGCIAMLLGLQQRYLEGFNALPDTYYLTRGWPESGINPLAAYENSSPNIVWSRPISCVMCWEMQNANGRKRLDLLAFMQSRFLLTAHTRLLGLTVLAQAFSHCLGALLYAFCDEHKTCISGIIASAFGTLAAEHHPTVVYHVSGLVWKRVFQGR